MPFHTNLSVIIFVVVLLDGWESSWMASNTFFLIFFGIKGLGFPVLMSHRILPDLPLRSTSSSVSDVSFPLAPSSSCWSRRSSCRLSPRCAVVMVFLERVLATAFSLPAMWWKVQSNSEMAESCRCCRLEHGSIFFVKACTNGRWSVWIRNGRPSRRCLKCRVARWTARSSLSKVEYRHLVLDSFLLFVRRVAARELRQWRCRWRRW